MFSNTVTVYSTKDCGLNYEKTVYNNVSIYKKDGIETSGGGEEKRNEYIIRILTSEEIFVCESDLIVIGETADIRPDFSKCLKICEVSDNRRGIKNLWHYKLRCK